MAFALAETCVFDKQSLGPLHCGHISVAPLLPKLRGHFAEFLNKGSPVRLRIFFSSTCVGLRYGHLYTISTSFSRQCASWKFVTYFSLYLSIRVFPLPRIPSTSASLASFKYIYSAGISTCCPSRTPFGLRLGPDFLRADEPSPENLRLSTAEFLAPLSLLMPAFSLPYRPLPLPLQLLPVCIAPLPIELLLSPSFGVRFEPR